MKNVSLILCLGLVMSGCSMMGTKNAVDRPSGSETEPYLSQELTSKFNRDGVETFEYVKDRGSSFRKRVDNDPSAVIATATGGAAAPTGAEAQSWSDG